MRLALYTVANAANVSDDNPLGFIRGTLPATLGAIIADLEGGRVDFDRYDGVVLTRVLGHCDAETVGTRRDGFPVRGMVVGSFDHYQPTPGEYAQLARIKELAGRLVVYVGSITKLAGLPLYEEWPDECGELVSDMLGTNDSLGGYYSEFSGVEPYPPNSLRPEWFHDPHLSYTMVGYLGKHPPSDWPPRGEDSLIGFNNGKDLNRWLPLVADYLESAGWVVVQPVYTIPRPS